MNTPSYPFQLYEAKPVFRAAFEITKDVLIKKFSEDIYEAHMLIHGGPSTLTYARQIAFRAQTEPKVGDWVAEKDMMEYSYKE